MANTRPVIAWSTIKEWYDAETGDQITRAVAEREYYVLKTESQKTFNELRTRCIIKIQKICAKKPQLKLDL